MHLQNHKEVLEEGEEEYDIEGEAHLEEELINALSELNKIREKYAQVKEQLAYLKRKNPTSSGISEEAK